MKRKFKLMVNNSTNANRMSKEFIKWELGCFPNMFEILSSNFEKYGHIRQNQMEQYLTIMN